MPSRQLNLAIYDTDKIGHYSLEVYNPILAPWVNKEIKLLEVSIHKEGSLQLWRDYFKVGVIIGIDIKLPEHFVPGQRIKGEANRINNFYPKSLIRQLQKDFI